MIAAAFVAAPAAAFAGPIAPAPGNNGLWTFVDEPVSSVDDAAVNVANGNLLVTANDGSMTSNTIQLQYDRYYNSQSTANSDGLSSGWSLSAGPSVWLGRSIKNSNIVANLSSGAVATFTQSSPGTFSSTETSARLSQSSGGYTLTETSGETETFSVTGIETSVQMPNDANATAVNEHPASINLGARLDNLTNSQTGSIISTRLDSSGRITGVSDAAGNNLNYTYNAAGQLASLTVGTTSPTTDTTYSYNSGGQLASITAADGTSEAITYSGGLVTQLKVTPVGGTAYGYSFAYANPTSSTCQGTDVGQTTVTPIEGGSAATYCYTSTGVVDHSADQTGPTAVTNLDAYRATTGADVTVIWDPPADPQLPDGTPGSGIASYTYQYRVGSGAWSVSATSTQPSFTIPGASVPAGAQVTVQLAAVDSAGNTGTTASLTAPVDVGTSTLTTTPPAGAQVVKPAASTTDPGAGDSQVPGGRPPGSMNIWSTLDCQCYNGQKTIAYREGYYDKASGDGFGRVKVVEKHNMFAHVVQFIVGHSGHQHSRGTRGFNDSAWALHIVDGKVTESIQLYASYDTAFVSENHRSFGIITAFCMLPPPEEECPGWVNEAIDAG